jgi:hypothetical protein
VRNTVVLRRAYGGGRPGWLITHLHEDVHRV